MLGFLNKLFDNNAKDVTRLSKDVVSKVNALESQAKAVENLAEAFMKLRERVKGGESLDAVLPEAFALTREASIRTLGMRHFDVQLIGGASLHQGRIAEMKTGEGKTLVATLALALNALEGKGSHLVTVNDYLAKVGAEQMGLIYKTLGLTVGLIQQPMSPADRQVAYGCDITYVTNSELGFDYLRDNMNVAADQLVLRAETPLNFAIIDEVDSILIDEARTPLIISGQSEKSPANYYIMTKLTQQLEKGEAVVPGDKNRTEPTGDYTIDEKGKQVHLTEAGITKAEKLLSIDGLFTSENLELGHMLTQAIRAFEMYHKDKDYLVTDTGEVVIVDEFTGRPMPGRRYGEGLHQAIEAKEGVKIAGESQTLATITYQNFFKLYRKISGMTGTAKTEEKEFVELYGTDVLVIPTNLSTVRKDAQDVVYRSEIGKFKAVIEEICERAVTGQPVLVGTISVEKSEFLSRLLSEPNRYVQFIEATAGKLTAQLVKGDATFIEETNKLLKNPGELTLEKIQPLKAKLPKNALEYFAQLEREVSTLQILRKGVKHEVLNAKHLDREADIVAQAGRSNSVTISTNMAGRGTDIKLGGSVEFAAYGMLEKKSVSRYDDYAELFVAACIRDDRTNATKMLEHIPKIEAGMIDEIIGVREAFKVDFEKVRGLGGLHIIGTERHESRRIDNQLRGRAGRQGDPGSSRYYVSFEDDLMRLFANERVVGMLDKLGMDDTVPIEAQMVTSAIERAQKRVEERNFGVRKQLLEFDNVMSKQREVIYAQRREMLLGKDAAVEETLEGMIGDFVEAQGTLQLSGNDASDWNLEQLRTNLTDAIPGFEDFDYEGLRDLKVEQAKKNLLSRTADLFDVRKAEFPPELWSQIQRFVLLQVVDQYWKEHLHGMDVLRQGIFLRAHGQKDPFVEYKFEATTLFNEMIEGVKAEITKYLFRLQVNYEQAPQPQEQVIDVQAVSSEPEVETARSDQPSSQPGVIPFAGGSNPFLRQQETRIPKMSRQERRRLERDNKK
jgi:preprotein translocase subunit SecA